MPVIWVDDKVVVAIHNEQMAEHGGGSGLRDGGLLQSALFRPLNRAHYDDINIPVFAASYGYGLINNHPFVDGNKRTALVVAELFLTLNGHQLYASDEDCFDIFMALAGGLVREQQFAGWLEINSEKL